MVRLLLVTFMLSPGLLHAYTQDEYMPIAPRPTIERPKEIVVPSTHDAPIGDIKPYEQTYDL